MYWLQLGRVKIGKHKKYAVVSKKKDDGVKTESDVAEDVGPCPRELITLPDDVSVMLHSDDDSVTVLILYR